MLHRKTALRLVAPVAVLALTLSACNGSDDADAKGAATAAADSSPSTGGSASASASASTSAAGGDVATGESVTGKVAEEPGEVTYEIAAQKVDVGTEAEAQKVVSDPKDAKGMVLAIAHVKFTHQAGPALTDSSDANDGTTVWADEQRGSILIGASADDVAGCDDPYDVESWKQGESHVFCETYLVPVTAKSIEVHWSEEDGEPFIWKFPHA
ncbi:hypothetical protein SAMN04487983_103344 [Streptomyces sp. yr375]|uniref:hypothetical protein n=1 Tax=Streptomyces sp. yr375 TaxID=1761906 RepID=UPI0008BBD0CA|nr:hypothetical protein [Streptomyces sp. yr375]SES15727.1 hypothetical protein SAMN04487983_103344 [Streptomyces sp. yr375]